MKEEEKTLDELFEKGGDYRLYNVLLFEILKELRDLNRKLK